MTSHTMIQSKSTVFHASLTSTSRVSERVPPTFQSSPGSLGSKKATLTSSRGSQQLLRLVGTTQHTVTRRPKCITASASSTQDEYPTFPIGTAGRETCTASGLERLPLKEDGWNYYDWSHKGKTHKLHYIQEGDSGSPVVLIHGFGAHAYHWRYTIPALAKKHRVYAVCLLGYGWSDKAVIKYSAETWATQVLEFCRNIVGTEEVTLVGNSIGGIACLATASLMPAVKGVVLLNSAGNFDAEDEIPLDESKLFVEAPEEEASLQEQFKSLIGKLVAQVIFLSTKYRIGYFLKQVYSNQKYVDDQLVKSIFNPACDPDAPAAFFELSQAGQRTEFTIRGALKQIKAPMLLLWGMQDPWMKPERADTIRELYPTAEFVPLESAGHCPQDDDPKLVNQNLLSFLDRV